MRKDTRFISQEYLDDVSLGQQYPGLILELVFGLRLAGTNQNICNRWSAGRAAFPRIS